MRHMTFVFAGGHLDGLSVSTDSEDVQQSDDARTYAVLTNGGRLGMRFKAPSTLNFSRIMAGTPTTPDERYEVVERVDEGGWRWTVRLQAIGPVQITRTSQRTFSDEALEGFGFTHATFRNAAGTTFPGLESKRNAFGCWVRFSPYLDTWEYGDGDFSPVPTPATDTDLRQLLTALGIP